MKTRLVLSLILLLSLSAAAKQPSQPVPAEILSNTRFVQFYEPAGGPGLARVKKQKQRTYKTPDFMADYRVFSRKETLRSVLMSREWEDVGSGQICTFTTDSVHFRWNYETIINNPRCQATEPYYLSETADAFFNDEKVGVRDDGLFLCTPMGSRKCFLYEILSFSDTEINIVLRRLDGSLWQQHWIPYNPQTSPPREMVEK